MRNVCERNSLRSLLPGSELLFTPSQDPDGTLGRTLRAKIEAMSSNPFLPCLKKSLSDEEIDKTVTSFSNMVVFATKFRMDALVGEKEKPKSEFRGAGGTLAAHVSLFWHRDGAALKVR